MSSFQIDIRVYPPSIKAVRPYSGLFKYTVTTLHSFRTIRENIAPRIFADDGFAIWIAPNRLYRASPDSRFCVNPHGSECYTLSIALYMLIIGERMDITMTPTTIAMSTIISGSIIAMSDCTAISTSSS